MNADVTKIDELRTIRELSNISKNLNGLAVRLHPVMVNGTRVQRELVATAIGEVAEQAASLSLLLARSIHTAEPSPVPLQGRFKLLRLAAEPMLNEVSRAKCDDGVAVELFGLLQAVIGLVWANGKAKSSDITAMSKTVYSRSGWDNLWLCRERTRLATVGSGDHE